MTLQILNQYNHDGMKVTEHTKDGTTVSHTVKTPIQIEPVDPPEPLPPITEEILYETKYQTILLEMGIM